MEFKKLTPLVFLRNIFKKGILDWRPTCTGFRSKAGYGAVFLVAVFDKYIFKYVRSLCLDPHGSELAIFRVVNGEVEFLLVRNKGMPQHTEKHPDGIWQVSMGFIVSEDDNVKETAKRILSEETNLAEHILMITPLAKFLPYPNHFVNGVDGHDWPVAVQVENNVEPKTKGKLTDKFGEAKFFKLDEIFDLIVNGEFFCGMSQASLLNMLAQLKVEVYTNYGIH